MKEKALLTLAVLAVIAAAGTVISRGSGASKQSVVDATPAQKRDWLLAGPGKVEPQSEDIKLSAEISGKLRTVLVEEGDRVQRGQLLAELVNSDYQAQVAAAEAEAKQREAELRKVINGARREERRQALSSVAEAKAAMNNAESEMQRHQRLFAAGVVSREEAERYAKEYDVAKARFEQKVQNHVLIDEDAREEDRSVAEANVQGTRAKLDEARALLAKTYIRAPIDGIILRRFHHAGESVSNGSTNPDPIFAMGDNLPLRVRVDVDEADVSKLSLGRKAYVTADAYRDRKYWGHVVRIGQELGRKNVRTDEPTERVDSKILETLIQLDSGADLPIGLRVNAFIVSNDEEAFLK